MAQKGEATGRKDRQRKEKVPYTLSTIPLLFPFLPILYPFRRLQLLYYTQCLQVRDIQIKYDQPFLRAFTYPAKWVDWCNPSQILQSKT